MDNGSASQRIIDPMVEDLDEEQEQQTKEQLRREREMEKNRLKSLEFSQRQKQILEQKQKLIEKRETIKKNLNMILINCSKERKKHQKTMNMINHAKLIQGIKQMEESKLCKTLIQFENSDPMYLKEFIHENHKERINKNEIQREVIRDHRQGIADPGRLAATSENRMFFRDYIKTDDFGRKRHIVEM